MTSVERLLLNSSTLLVAATGAAYFGMKYLMTGGDEFSVIHHPWQPGTLVLHVLAGPILVFAVGLIVRDHIIERLRDRRQKRGRVSGIVLVAIVAPMIASGYLVQVVTGTTSRTALAYIHIAAGTLYVLMFAAHLVVSRNGRRRSDGPTAAARRTRRPPRPVDRSGQRGIVG